MQVYISTPRKETREATLRSVDAVKAALSRKGHRALCRHTDIFAGKDPTEAQMLGYCITAILSHADAVYMCEGWEQDRDCQVEHFVARTFGIKTIYENDEQI